MVKINNYVLINGKRAPMNRRSPEADRGEHEKDRH